jgi:hypothetical protein
VPFTPQRRWFRFSLRTLFVVVTVACAPCGWLGRQFYVARERQELLYDLNNAGQIYASRERLPAPYSFPVRTIYLSKIELIDGRVNSRDLERIKAVFPEATISLRALEQ